jgi:hypothetical protein
MPVTINTRIVPLLQPIKFLIALPVLFAGLFLPFHVSAVEHRPVGELVTWQGEVQITRTNTGDAFPASRNVYDGDVLVSGASSWGALELHDASRLVIGPDTELKVGFSTRDNRHYIDLKLEQGSVRIASGLACMIAPGDCVVTTPYGKLQLFSALADMWLCEQDCSDIVEAPAHLAMIPSGRVVYLQGELNRRTVSGGYMPMFEQDPIYISDEFNVGQDSCAVIAFRDGSILSARDGQHFNASDPALRRGPGACKGWQPAGGLDFRALFGTTDSKTLSYGLFVKVRDGHLRLGDGDRVISIGRNEAGYMGNGPPVRIGSWPGTSLMQQVPDPAMMSRRAH